MKTLALGLAAYESAETGRTVDIRNGFVTLNNPAARFAELLSAEQAKMRAFLLN